ncbi:MAG TPA: AraC family transcriptional regulator [Nevskia sp.]|nr:AraC family transcriptional regulator [Nevskia sp.]
MIVDASQAILVSASAAPRPPPDPALAPGQVELVALLNRLTREAVGSVDTAVEGLRLHRVEQLGQPKPAVSKPALGLIAQGSKRLLVGGEVYEYDPMHYLVTSVDLPVTGRVTVASADEPYLGLSLDLHVKEIADLIRDENLPPLEPMCAARAMFVTRLSATLLDSVLRLLRLLETPRDAPILAPLAKREILYRLLMDGQGARLRQIVLHDSQTQRVAKAIRMLHDNFVQPLRVESIARDVHMSVSSLHHQFKAVTAMSPLQYQKQLRLHEGRRLMLLGDTDVATAAHRVGYESPSQFSREYSRLFGAPPLRDRRRWQDSPPQD